MQVPILIAQSLCQISSNSEYHPHIFFKAWKCFQQRGDSIRFVFYDDSSGFFGRKSLGGSQEWKQCHPWVIYHSYHERAERAMAPHSSTLAWRIPRMEEPGRLQSMGSLRVRHNWATSLSLFTFLHWRRKWQPTSVFLPGESQGWGSLVGWHLWGRTESDMTEVT